MATAPPPPKACLFDIGGVCVVSPMQAIADYERAHNIPRNWINFAISRSSRGGNGGGGAWARAERGESELDNAWFEAFRRDLHSEEAWREYWRVYAPGNDKRRKKDAGSGVVAEGAGIMVPTGRSQEESKGRATGGGKGKGDAAAAGRTQTAAGAGLMVPAEQSTSQDSGGSRQDPAGAGLMVQAEHDAGSSTTTPSSSPPSPAPQQQAPQSSAGAGLMIPTEQQQQSTPSSSSSSTVSHPAHPPTIDSTTLFWTMMLVSRSPDPHMAPALRRLRDSNSFILGALSNTMHFPSWHPFSKTNNNDTDPTSFDPRSAFDVFVGSADVGLRKPSPAIYELALRRLDAFDRARGGSGVRPHEVLFLDDIGENLKSARALGMRTLRVWLGRSDEAVEQLERETGVVGLRGNATGSKL